MEEKLNEKAKDINNLNNYQKDRINQLRSDFSEIYNSIELNCESGRETSLALTKLEEAQMWAIKGITREKVGE